MSTTPSPPAFELFLPDDCHRPLPLNQIVDVFRFSKFVGLTRDVQGTPTKVVAPRSSVFPGYVTHLAGVNPSANLMDLEGGVPLDSRANDARLIRPLSRTAKIDDLESFLADPRITVGKTKFRVELDPSAIRRLLAGRAAGVQAIPEQSKTSETAASDDTAVVLLLQPQDAGKPASLEHVIPDLAAFIRRPVLPGKSGSTISLKLDSSAVRSLREQGRAELKVGDNNVVVQVKVDELSPQSSTSEITMGGSGPAAPPAFELALNLQWTQTWILKGYSRGNLLNTISLAPQEETTIEIFTWDRRRSSVERSSSVDVDESIEQSDTVRDTTDVMRQAQSSSEFAFQGGANVGVNIYDVVNIGASVSASDKTTFANLSKTSTNFIHESVTKAASKVKQSRQSKVSESTESGREERVTRKIRNPNMCHTLNLDYFEVLASYNIVTKFVPNESGLCVLVDNPLKLQFDRWALRVYEKALRRALVDRNLAPGFDAAHLLYSREQACRVLCETCHCSSNMSDADAADVLSAVQGTMNVIGSRFPTLESSWIYLHTWFEYIETSNYFELRNPVRLSQARWWVYAELLKLGAPSLWAVMGQVFSEWKTKAFTAFTTLRLRQELDSVGGLEAIRPQKLFAEHKDHLGRAIGNQYSVWRLESPHPPIENEFILTFVYSTGLLDTFDDFSLTYAFSQFITSFDTAVSAQKAAGEAQAARDDSASDAVESAFGLKDVTDALDRESALLAHLNIHGDYYRAMLWNALTPSTQSGFLQPLLPRELVESRAVGFIGNKLAFPVRIDDFPPAKQLLDDLITSNTALNDLQRDVLVTLPTPAVTVEPRLGMCDACEDFIQKHRELDIALKRAEVGQAEQRVAQEKLETERYQKRLAATPPQLNDPDPGDSQNAIRIIVSHEEKKAES